MLPVPERFRFAGIAAVPAAASLEALIEPYSEDDREHVLTFISKFPDAAYEFDGEEELAWMAAAGFPMPDDILAARDVDDDAQVAQAMRGNAKAAFLAWPSSGSCSISSSSVLADTGTWKPQRRTFPAGSVSSPC